MTVKLSCWPTFVWQLLKEVDYPGFVQPPLDIPLNVIIYPRMAYDFIRQYLPFDTNDTPLFTVPVHLLQRVHTHYTFSCDKAKRLLGYEPVFSSEQGIKKCAKWSKKGILISLL